MLAKGGFKDSKNNKLISPNIKQYAFWYLTNEMVFNSVALIGCNSVFSKVHDNAKSRKTVHRLKQQSYLSNQFKLAGFIKVTPIRIHQF